MNPIVKYLLLPLAALAALVAAWLWLAWSWSYSSGERAGWVQQFSKRGWICKTWEGELALVSLPGSTTEKFFFTVHDDAVAARITIAEVEELVEPGQLDPDQVHLPGIYVKRIFVGKNYQKPIEQRTIRQRPVVSGTPGGSAAS